MQSQECNQKHGEMVFTVLFQCLFQDHQYLTPMRNISYRTRTQFEQ